jgi:hypothetical protein
MSEGAGAPQTGCPQPRNTTSAQWRRIPFTVVAGTIGAPRASRVRALSTPMPVRLPVL